jgi:hypothetical protein
MSVRHPPHRRCYSRMRPECLKSTGSHRSSRGVNGLNGLLRQILFAVFSLLCPQRRSGGTRLARPRSGMRSRVGVMLLTALVVLLSTVGGASATTTSGRPSANSLSADWWKWAAGLSASKPPCDQPPAKPVFFVSELKARQTCSVPNGTLVYASVINFEWSKTEALGLQAHPQKGFPSFCSQTKPLSLLACAAWQAGHITRASASLDGKNLPVTAAVAPAFTMTWSSDNPFGVAPGPSPAAAVGLYVKTRPAPGVHTLRLQGSANFNRDLGFVFAPQSQVTLRLGPG